MNFLRRVLLRWVFSLFWITAAYAETTEKTGSVRIEAENFSDVLPRTIGSAEYTWAIAADLLDSGSSFSGSGYIQANATDGSSIATIGAAWETDSPQIDYTVTFSNAGTYYVWVRGFAASADTAGIYVGMDGSGSPSVRMDLQQFNQWTWSNSAVGSPTPVAFNVPTPGIYTLKFWMRDSGVAMDRILLTLSPTFRPTADADFWKNQNIYQIITDRFFDGDPSNNNFYGQASPSTGNKTHGGDWKGIENKLDYIKALGATAIWISPVLKNANGDFDYHGYAATDFYNVDPRFGSLQDLQRLVAEAHRRDILVIADVVVNHGSTWVDSSDTNWPNFVYPPGGYNLRYNSGGRQYAPPFDNASLQAQFGNNNLSNIFHNHGTTQNWGDSSQVELGELLSLDDFRTESNYVRQRMKEIWTHWIESVGFDAYRLDTVKHVEMGFWNDWSPAIRAAAQAADKPNFFQFGEVFDGSDAKVGSYTGTKSGGNYKMESVLDYPLYYQMGSVFATATGNTGQIEGRYNNLTTANYDASALDSLVLNIDNHDNPRFLAATGSTTGRLELALVFMYTARGIPSLYYGTEQDFNGGADPANREDMFDGLYEQGPSLGDNFNMTSTRFKLVAKLNNLRRLYPALRTGTYHSLWANFGAPGLLAYARRLNGEEAYVVINTATTQETIGARPTIHPAGTVLVDALNPSNTLTVTAGVDGIPSLSMPPTSCRIYIAQNQMRALAPLVNAITPAHDAASVNPASLITVTFSQSMNSSATQAAFATTPSSTGSFVWSSNNTVMTYTPSSNLGGNTLYAVRIESTAADSNGLAMHAPFESRLTTGTNSGAARPSINSFSVSGITDTTAILSAAVTPNGAATTVSSQYGMTTSYGSTTTSQSIGSGNSPINVTANLTGLAPGTTYHYRVSASNTNGTTLGNNGTFTTSLPLPQVTTSVATEVRTGSAVLNGKVNPNNLATTVLFEWGDRADQLPNRTIAQDVGSGSTNLDRSNSITGLNPDTTYFFRMVGVSGATEVPGATLSFHTEPVKPTVTTLQTTNIGIAEAVLPGVFNPNGSDTIFSFEYGTNSAYGATTLWQSAGNGTAALSLNSTATNLSPGQTYFYRAVASNSFGTSYGKELSFSAGFAPPAATTLNPVPLTSSSFRMQGSVNPNGSHATAWFEWGTNGSYGFTSRQVATDSMETYNDFNLTSGNISGGSNFGSYTLYPSVGAGTFLAINSSNQTIDGTKSVGVWPGTNTGISFYRSLSNPRQFGRITWSARFNVNPANGFAGFNLKSTQGNGFGEGELVSVGVSLQSGTNGLLVTDAAGQRILDMGAPVTNIVIDFMVDFDARNRRHITSAKFRTNSIYNKIAGMMKGAGTNFTHIGFGNWCLGDRQDLLFDSLEVRGSEAINGGTNPITLSNTLFNLTGSRTYYYRVASMSLDGGVTYGNSASFYTGLDFAISSAFSGGSFAQGSTGQFTINVSNVGGANGTGTITVTNQIPMGMTITSMSGSGWTFNTNNRTATRSDRLNRGLSYNSILVNVSVASNAPSKVTNVTSLSLSSTDGNLSNNTAISATSVAPGPDLVLLKELQDPLQQDTPGSFFITVFNNGGSPSTGTITVTEQPPAGMTVTSMAGSGWVFDASNRICTRSAVLGVGESAPPIEVAVMLASNAPIRMTNLATVSGGGDVIGTNNAAQAASGVTVLLTPRSWREEFFGVDATSWLAADTNAPAGDGIPNLVKYALGISNVLTPATNGLPEMKMTNNRLALTFNRQKSVTDIVYKVQATGDLFGFSNNPTVWSSASNAYGGGTNASEAVTVQDTVDTSTTNRRFMRLQISRP